MSIVFNNLVEASEKSTTELEEKLMHQSRCALLAFDIRDQAKQAVSLFDGLNAGIREWQDEISSLPDSEKNSLDDFGAQWDSLYRRIATIFEKTAHLIQGIEAIGPSVDGKPAFFKAWRSLRAAIAFSQESVAASVDQLRRNEVRPLGEISRALFGVPND
jgi:hypothetical protein